MHEYRNHSIGLKRCLHGQLFGTTKGGAEVDLCHHIPLGNWLASFCHARVSLTKAFACQNKGH